MNSELNAGPFSKSFSEAISSSKRTEMKPANLTSSTSDFDGSLNTEHWTQVFNTAMISTRVEGSRGSSADLFALLQEPAFNALLSAIQQLATTKGVSEIDAAKEMVMVFRKLDQVWTELLVQEGFERLKGRN